MSESGIIIAIALDIESSDDLCRNIEAYEIIARKHGGTIAFVTEAFNGHRLDFFIGFNDRQALDGFRADPMIAEEQDFLHCEIAIQPENLALTIGLADKILSEYGGRREDFLLLPYSSAQHMHVFFIAKGEDACDHFVNQVIARLDQYQVAAAQHGDQASIDDMAQRGAAVMRAAALHTAKM